MWCQALHLMFVLATSRSWAAEPPAPCPDAALAVERATQNVATGRLQDAQGDLRSAEQGWSCGGFADQDLLARYWLAEGALLAAQGDPTFEDSFRAARRLRPEAWDERLGQAMRLRYLAVTAPSQELAGVQVRYEPTEPPADLAVDGARLEIGTIVPPGLHLFQIGRWPDSVELERMLLVQPGDEVVLHRAQGGGTASAAEAEGGESARRWRPRWGLVIGGAAMAGVGGGLLYAATAQDDRMQEASETFNQSAQTSDDAAEAAGALEAAFTRQKILGGLGYGLVGVGVIGVSVGIVW